jgi:hypothetical protein
MTSNPRPTKVIVETAVLISLVSDGNFTVAVSFADCLPRMTVRRSDGTIELV